MKSLLITHNSWFLNQILPKINHRDFQLVEHPISAQKLFDKMKFADWMDNGIAGLPPSSRAIKQML